MLRDLLLVAASCYGLSVVLAFSAVVSAQRTLAQQLQIEVPRAVAMRFALRFALMGPLFLYHETRRSVGLAFFEILRDLHTQLQPKAAPPQPGDDGEQGATRIPDEVAQLILRMGLGPQDSRPVS